MPASARTPFAFVLDELRESPLAPLLRTRSMFGCTAIYIDERIVFILRRKQTPATLRDDGIWIAAVPEHRASLQRDFPSLRRLEMFGDSGFAGWLNLPEDSEDFESAALEACRLVIAGDRRIGKVPPPRKRKSTPRS